MTEILPFRLGMIIGRTYDLRNHSIGHDIFPEEYTANPQRVECPSTIVKYGVIKNSSDVNNILEVSGDISLKVKAGFMNVQGMGSYLREDRSKENALEILAIAHVETISTTLKNTQTVDNWNRGMIGTHYIRSIIYGADLVVSIRIIAAESRRLKDIKANVDSTLQIQGVIDAEAKANFRKLEQDLKDSSEIKLSYYCTIPGIPIPKDVDTMLKTLEHFQNELCKINNGDGAPLRCEVVPLAFLNDNFPRVLRQTGLESQLRELEQMYDELRQAKSMLQKCLDDDVEYMTDEQQEKVTEIDNRIQKVMSCFNKVISKIDVTTAGNSLDEIQRADMFYRENVKLGSFQREVKQFIKQASKSVYGTPMKELPHGVPLSILLLGKTGHGKSATGNSIFGEDKFLSTLAADSVSVTCHMASGSPGGRDICLVDTPGVMDTNFPDKALNEIGTAIAYQPQGFHAFIFVINIFAKITNEEKMAITLLKNMFGEDILTHYGIIVFTHGDSFMKDKKIRKDKTTFLEYIKNQRGYIKSVLQDCDYRCILIDNSEEDPGLLRDQVIPIITLIDELVKRNNGTTYTNHMFEMAQKRLKEEEMRLEEEKDALERKRQEEIEAIRNEARENAAKIIQDMLAMYDAKLKENAKMLKQKEQTVGNEIALEASEHGGCFPPDALVKLDDGRTITIANLRIGQKVLSSSSSGTLEYSEVYYFAHLNPYAINRYIILNTCNQTLKLTPGHHIYVVRHGFVKTIAARDVKIGDNVLVLNTNVSSLLHHPVLEISKSVEVGVYAPITMSGAIVVNNILASCYVDIVPPLYSHHMLWPMRQLYRLSPSLATRINVVGKKGMPTWVQWIMDNLLA